MVYTAYKFSREVERWWQAKNVLLFIELGSEQAITWDILNEEFNRHFFPQVVQQAKAREFIDVVQGGMIVTEYAAKFIQLSRFSIYLIPDKEKKGKNFESSLNLCIKTMMVSFDIQVFSQLVDRSSVYEESLRKNAATIVE